MVRMSKLRTSVLAPGSVQSEIRAMSLLSEQAGGINMAQGICDTEVPAPVKAEAHAAIEAGHNIYTRQDGIARLRKAIAADWQRRHGLSFDPETEVMGTSGATGAFHAASMALLDAGDEAILFEPLYGYHAGALKSIGVDPVIVPLEYGAGDHSWAVNIDAVRAAVTPKTRVMVINSPGNPSGKVFTRAELTALAELAIEHDLFVFSDEIYEHFIYPGHEHVAMASLPGMRERTITISGFSKTFSVTGWRVGYLIADAKWVPSIGYFHDMLYVCAPAPFQHGCAAGLEQLAALVLCRARHIARQQARTRGGRADRRGAGTACAGWRVLHPVGRHAAEGCECRGEGSLPAAADGRCGGGGVRVLPQGRWRKPAALLLRQARS